MRLAQKLVLFCFTGAVGCSNGVKPYSAEPFPSKLSRWGLFKIRSGRIEPTAGVLPYDLNTPLFSDYASKYRYVWMPPGSAARYRQGPVLEFPAGTILVKTFAFPDASGSEKRIETRLLVRTQTGWFPLLYEWNDAQSEALLKIVPDPVRVVFTSADGQRRDFTYVMPNRNECHECHDQENTLIPIGPKAPNLNKDYDYPDGRENQLERWARVGYLRDLPERSIRPRAAKWDDPASGSVADRAHAYLDSNCAHCHQPGGQAGYTGVDFRLSAAVSEQGWCKAPNSAGYVGSLRFDIVPGRPDRSILIYRLESVRPKISMPALGRDVVHREGVALLREWIASLPGRCSEHFASD
jgi:uncharacterized repeat protein (TIGR03806 family)